MLDKINKIKRIIELNKEHSKVYDVIHFFNFYKNHLENVKSKITDREGSVVLDVGCGTGNFKYFVNKAYYIGLDISREMLVRAKRKFPESDKCDFILSDAHHLPFKDSSLDAVVCINVLYQLPEPQKFLLEAGRVLKDEGIVVISTPHAESTFRGLYKAALRDLLKNPLLIFRLLYKLPSLKRGENVNKQIMKHSTLLPKQKLEELMEDNGLAVISMEDTYGGQNLLLTLRKQNDSI